MDVQVVDFDYGFSVHLGSLVGIGVGCVAQAVAEEIERQHGDGDRGARQ